MTKKRRTSFLVVVGACAFLSACTSVGYVDNDDPVYQQFQQLCRQKAGARVYETVENVRGVYGIHPIRGLRDLGYEHVEYRVPDHYSRERAEHSFYVPGPGLYRYKLMPQNHPTCDQYYKSIKRSLNSYDGNTKLPDQECIASEKIEKISTKFKVMRAYINEKEREKPGEYYGAKTVFEGEKNGETVIFAEMHTYKYIGHGASRNKFGAYHGIYCPDSTSDIQEPSETDIFRPTMSSRVD